MALQRRSPPQHRTHPAAQEPTLSTRRTYPLRRTLSRTSSHAPHEQSISSPVIPTRPVLVPLHNLRRLPSRTFGPASRDDKDSIMRESSHLVQVGAKRKRVASSNENAHTQPRQTRRPQKRKRSSATNTRRYASTSEESDPESSEMELDPPSRRWPANDSEEDDEDEEVEEDDEEDDDSNDYLLYSAPHARLNRLKKGELVDLYRAGGLPEDPELLTKAEIIEVIIEARDEENASLPPSSPPGRTDAASSDYSSDDGNVAGDEEEQEVETPTVGPQTSALKRRSTTNEVVKSPSRPLKGRSLSLGTMLHSNGNGHAPPLKRKSSLRIITDTSSTSRQRSTNRSSPSTSGAQSAVTQTAPVHRLRSRKISAPTPVAVGITPTSTGSKGKGKGKAKQVEFIDEPIQPSRTSSRRRSKEKEQTENHHLRGFTDESDLTDLDDEADVLPQPSPRRLRSKDRAVSQEKDHYHADAETTPTVKRKGKGRSSPPSSAEPSEQASLRPKRVLPVRKAKRKIKSLRESDLEMGSQEEEEEEEDQLVDDDVGVEEEQEEEEGEDDDLEGEDEVDVEGEEEEVNTEEENEVDELVSTASITPPVSAQATRRTPIRQRLRHRKDSGSGDEAEEGDDEHEETDEDADADGEEVEGDDEEVDDDEETLVVEEPRRLRNGKVVGDDDIHMETEVEEDAVEQEVTAEDSEEEHEEEVEDEPMDQEEEEEGGEATDEEVDLTVATAKTLTRLRKDDLVRLCESRNLEPVGNKRELAKALLQWRDNQRNDLSSPSSAGTVRAPSTARRGRAKRSAVASGTPVLLRSQGDQFHTDEPRTPVPNQKEEDLELDLESLGLEDREIPPEKIVKLEKIGSGGFKDVFIGKFKGRRIAIAEFRGTLSSMDIKELKLLGGFDHPNIVRFLGVSIPENTKETPVMIVSELCSNGDLFDYIRNVPAPTLHKVLRMMLDIASGLEYLHMRTPSVIHRDCKSSNILITAKGIAKIADFGLAKVKESTRSMVRSLVGTVNWQAPELWTAHPNYNHKVDVFSCAMVFWEMLQWHVPNKKFPWEGMNEHAIYDVVGAKKQRPSIAGLRKQWCPEVVDLLEHMWAQDPRDRPTMSQVVTTLKELVATY